jgi:uncharacterized protein
MEVELKERPRNPVIIEGFPGFGFAGTIATEFLIKHLNAKRIGKIFSSKLTPMVAFHNSEIIDPLEIHYSKKYNLIIVRSLTNITGAEWDIADILMDLSKKLNAKEIISLEGIGSEKISKSKVYYFTNSEKHKTKFENINLEKLENGVIMGVTGVLILKMKKTPFSCIFVQSNPSFPDSRAAGEIIKVLDNYLGLKVDYTPLIRTAEDFEKKLKQIISKADNASKQKVKRELTYTG